MIKAKNYPMIDERVLKIYNKIWKNRDILADTEFKFLCSITDLLELKK
jgi:hypothetical protein